jgi:hypothetical protein
MFYNRDPFVARFRSLRVTGRLLFTHLLPSRPKGLAAPRFLGGKRDVPHVISLVVSSR